MYTLLIVEDDKILANGIALALKGEQFTIVQAQHLKAAKQYLRENPFDLILLDVNLPDGNGIEFLRELRKTSHIPVILLTANDMEIDIVIGLESGADDYVTKPFSLAILRARVSTQLRKKRLTEQMSLVIDEFSFDFERMVFMKNNQSIELSKTEQKLLKMLVQNKGITLSREVLIDRIWTDGADYVDENALSVTIKRLRNKLEETPAKPSYIKTVYGIGYTWVVKA